MRIRHYVFDLLAGTGNSVVKLPSNREIARKFGVSQPTVVKALQELVREGYLTIRPGVGAFSNPDRFTHDSKLWGIVLGDGRWSQFSRETLHVINSVGMALLEHDHRNLLKLITMGETMDDERGWPELSMLSGICWWIPTDPLLPSMARIARTIPVVLLGDRKPGFDCFFRDFENENCEIARRMIADGCRRLVLVLPEMEQAAAIRGVEKACREAGCEFPPGCVLQADTASQRDLERMVDLHCCPDGIIFNRKPNDFIPIILSRPELARCRIYCDSGWIDKQWPFHGYSGEIGFDTVAPMIAALLHNGLSLTEPKQRPIPVKLEPLVPQEIRIGAERQELNAAKASPC